MTNQQWPFADAGEEFRALLAKMTSEQRQAMRARIEGGKIDGSDPYVGSENHCGCIYATAWFVMGNDGFYWDDFERGEFTPLEEAVLRIESGQTPADNLASRWLVDMMTAFESEQG